MKNQLRLLAPAAALMIAITGCSSTSVDTKPKTQNNTPVASQQTKQAEKPTVTVDAVKEVAYKCGPKGEPLRVQYGLSGNNVVVAQVLFQGKASPVLPRALEEQNKNLFTDGGVAWVAEKATAATVDKVNGDMLAQQAVETINGKKVPVSQVVTNACKLDKAATAKLAKAKK